MAVPGRKSKLSGTKSKPDGTKSKSGGTKSKFKILHFPSPNRALSMAYADARVFCAFVLLLLGRFLPQKRHDSIGVACSLLAVGRSFCLRFGSSSFPQRVKGWRRLCRGRLDAVSARLGGREPQGGNRGTVASTGNPRVMSPGAGAEDRDRGRKIDPMSGKKFAPPKRARTGFELLEKRTGASPSCLPSVSRTPAFDY